MDWNAFFLLHDGLPREGPGRPEDVDWAVRQAGVTEGARILDAGAGPGSDIDALLASVPGAHVTAVDTHAAFIEDIATSSDPTRVDARQSDMIDVVGPYDFIWSAGAVYFVGIEAALTAWRKALTPGSHVAFTHPAFFTDTPSDGARALWEGEAVETVAEARAKIAAAGFQVVADTPLPDESWEAYFGPVLDRTRQLRDGADAKLTEVLDAAVAEAETWRANRAETGYQLFVVRPA